MDEMRINLSSRIMKGIVARLIARAVYKKTGCKIDIRINHLKLDILDGETEVTANMKAKVDKNEFMKLMRLVDA